MSNQFKEGLKVSSIEKNVQEKKSLNSVREDIKWFTDEELELLRKAQKGKKIYDSEIGDDMSSGLYPKVSHDVSYLLSDKESKELFEKAVLSTLDKGKDEGGR